MPMLCDMSKAQFVFRVVDQFGNVCAPGDVPPATLEALVCERLGILPGGAIRILTRRVDDDEDWGPPCRDVTKMEKKKKKKKTP
jgi:hypothetical protein